MFSGPRPFLRVKTSGGEGVGHSWTLISQSTQSGLSTPGCLAVIPEAEACGSRGNSTPRKHPLPQPRQGPKVLPLI